MKLSKILPTILTWITGVKRERVDNLQFNSELITPNLFRLWELIFWRRAGIRPECGVMHNSVTKETSVDFYTFEAMVVHFETWVRGLIPRSIPVKIKVFKPVLADGFVNPSSLLGGYVFAITYDTFGFVETTPSSSTSWSHTISGSNTFVSLGVGVGFGVANNFVTSCTCAGSAMTQLDTQDFTSTFTFDRGYSFYKAAPATGANTIAITSTSSYTYGIVAVSLSYSGVSGTPIDGHNVGTGTSTTPNGSITTASNNCFVHSFYVYGGASGRGVLSAGSGTTFRCDQDDLVVGADAGSVTASSGTVVLQNYTSTVSKEWGVFMISLKTAGGTAYTQNFTESILSLVESFTKQAKKPFYEGSFLNNAGLVAQFKLDDLSGNSPVDSSGNGHTAPLKVSAIAYYPFDGDATDFSISAKNGTVNGASLATDRFGNSNGAYAFTGNGQYIQASIAASGVRSWAMWVKCTGNNTSGNAVFGSNGNADLQWYKQATNQWFFTFTYSGTRYYFSNGGTGIAPIADGNWHHYVVSFNQTTQKISVVVDGVLTINAVGASSTGSPFGSTTIQLGSAATEGNVPCAGLCIDEVIFMPWTLSTANMTNLYTLTSTHDLNKPFVSGGKYGNAADLWGQAPGAANAPGSYFENARSISDALQGQGNPWTIAWWCKLPTNNSDQNSIGWYGGNYKGPYFRLLSTGISCTIGRGNLTGVNANFSQSFSASPAANTWHHAAVTYDGNDVVVYLNGVQIGVANLGLLVDNGSGNQKFKINGNPWDNNNFGTSKFDDVRVYNRPLSAQEISTLYSQTNNYNTETFSKLFGRSFVETAISLVETFAKQFIKTFTIEAISLTSVLVKLTQKPLLEGIPLNDGNQVRNGDFRLQPTFVAPQTTYDTWIDGTATGSSSDNRWGWKHIRTSLGTGTGSFQYTTFAGLPCMKITTTAMAHDGVTTSIFGIGQTSYPGGTMAGNNEKSWMIPINPKLTYKYSYDHYVTQIDPKISFRMYGTYYDSAMNRISTINPGSAGTVESQWNTTASTFTPPSNAAFIQISAAFFNTVNSNPSSQGGTAYVTNIVVAPQISSGQYLIRSLLRSWSESFTLVENFAKQFAKIFTTETVTLVETMTHQIGKGFVETFTIVESFLKSFLKSFSATFTLSESFAKMVVHNAYFQETFNLVETFTKQVTKSFVELYSIVETFLKGKIPQIGMVILKAVNPAKNIVVKLVTSSKTILKDVRKAVTLKIK